LTPLRDVHLEILEHDLPDRVALFLREAESRIDRAYRTWGGSITGFVASDYVTVYWALYAIIDARLNACHTFCEWGSGLGVVASLASMLEMNACGIEINRPLVEAAELLAQDCGIPVEFVHGSFIPRGGEAIAEEVDSNNNDEPFYLETCVDDAYERLGLDPDDFDVVFAYPWPAERRVIERLFARYAARGAILLTYGHANTISVQQKLR
jgi:hypothetical protein